MIFDSSQQSSFEDEDSMHNGSVKQITTLVENDFIKMINLEERYNYSKSLMKIQRLQNLKEQGVQKSMVKIMLQLIDYYATCICEAQINMENIVKYFQNKLKDINSHYKEVMEEETKKYVLERVETEVSNLELGNITTCITRSEIEELSEFGQEDLKIRGQNSKCNLNTNLMMALHNQNIQEHLAQTDKKADLLRKSIANSIQLQEQTLINRMNRIKKKKIERKQLLFKNQTPNSIDTNSTPPNKSMQIVSMVKQISYRHINPFIFDSQGSQIDESELQQNKRVNQNIIVNGNGIEHA